MIGRLFTNDGANAALIVILSGTLATLVAHGPGRVSPGRALSGVLSNPIPRAEPSGAEALPPLTRERGAAA